MHLDPVSRMWKEDDNDYQPPKILDEPEEEDEDRSVAVPEQEPKKIKGKCTLSIRFENHGEYLKWKTYAGGRQWDFLVNYPAVMRAEYPFESSLDVEIMTRKIVQRLEMGFDVYSASWSLEEKEATT